MLLKRCMPRVLVLVLAASLLLSACGAKPDTSAPSGGEAAKPAAEATAKGPAHKIQGSLVYATVGEPVNFNPILASDTTSGFVYDRVFNGLVSVDEKFNPIPDLAEKWEISPDGLTFTFKLRQNVKFHDGKPLTADDVVYTFQAMKDPGYTGPRGSEVEPISAIEKVDQYTVKFTLKEPYAPMLMTMTYGILPKHLYADKPVAEMKNNPANRKPVGTGPYKFGEWVPGQYLTLVRNDEYFEKDIPYIPEVRLKFVQDQNVQVAQLEAGEIDLLGLPSREVARITKDYAGKLNFVKYDTVSIRYLAFNMTKPGLSDKVVRHALATAMDRQRIVNDVMAGEAAVLNGIMPQVSWAYTDNVRKYTVNKEQANKMLDDAGWKKGSDGIRAKDGVKLAYKLIAQSGSTEIDNTMLLMQQDAKDIGIDLKLENIEWSVFLEKYLWVGNFDLFISGFQLGSDPDMFDLFHSSMAEKNDKGRFKGFNRAQYRNAEMDKLLVDGRREMDQKKRQQIYEKVQQIFMEDLPWLPLYVFKNTQALKPKIQGTTFYPKGAYKPWAWWIEEK